MKWTFKIRGEAVTYTILESETAIKPTDAFLQPATSAALALDFGEMIEVEPFDGNADVGSPADRDVFKRAGWHFVHPHPAIAFAAEAKLQPSDAATIHQVILSDTNALLIATDLATVRFNDDLSEAQSEEFLAEDRLSIVYRLRFAPNTFEVRLPPGRPLPEIINTLQAKTDRYLYAEPSLLQIINGRQTPETEPEIASGKQWHHFNNGSNGGFANMDMGSLAAWKITRGARKRRVRIAVIDNGMQISHPDLLKGIVSGGFFKPVAVGEAEFIRLTSGMVGFPENNGHGTLCLGLAGARLNGLNGCGLAPDADLIAIACLNDQIGTQTTLARAIHYAADPSKEDKLATIDQGADVISCSLNTQNLLNSNLGDAITFAREKGRGGKGVPIFWAVSNQHTSIEDDKVFKHPHLIAVAAYNRKGIKTVSAFGDRLEYLAPGEQVFSTGSFNNFNSDDGTSFATPLAAGVAALVLSIQPDWTADEVRKLLRESCDRDPPAIAHDVERGFGRLSAATAVTKAKPDDL